MKESELPFGTVKEENLAESPNDPLIYAEAEIADGITLWWEPTKEHEFKLVLSPLLETVGRSLRDITNIKARNPITQEQAKEILRRHCDKEWTHVE